MARKKQSRRTRTNEKSAPPYPYDEKLGIQLPPEVEQEIKALVKNGQKIEAVQMQVVLYFLIKYSVRSLSARLESSM